jgi:pyruvate-ferredoxin/flavodoxin oxidoreductase
VGREAELPPDALTRLAEAVAGESGPFVRGGAVRPEPEAWEARVRAAPSDFPDPGVRAPVSLLLVAGGSPLELGRPLAAVSPAGTVLLATDDPPERAWAALPGAWRRTVEERDLRLFTVTPGFDAGLEALCACLRGEEGALVEAGSLRELAWRELGLCGAVERELPRVVRRIERIRTSHDSLPRFWGEVVQPRQEGASDDVPDPLTASGSVPAGASALAPDPATPVLPVLDPALCTGCGRCWTACPDGAIGVTALAGEALLGAASHLAGTQGKAADALRRAHKHVAGRLAGQPATAAGGELGAEACREAWSWTAGRMDLADEERPDYDAAFESTLGALTRLRPIVTEPFFRQAEDLSKGAGEYLVLAVDPRACLACGLCISACPEEALRAEARDADRVAEFEERWRAWEGLPDTPGATLERAADHPEVGPLAAILLSRHCAQAQVGGGAGEPGSGERLAARLVTAVVEQHAQRRVAALLKSLEERRELLEEKVRERLAESLTDADPDTLAEALGRIKHGRAELTELGEELQALGARATFERGPLLRMERLVGALERYRGRLAEGEDGLGRARFGVVVTGEGVAEWAARFPGHPYFAPLTLAPTASGVELARGIARGHVADHLELLRALRRATLEAEAPPDRSARLEAIDGLTWDDLEPEDRVSCPPLLLLGDDAALLEHGFDLLTRLLASDLPVKVVLLDARGRLRPAPEPALVAMAHQRAFVVAASLAHPEHLARGVSDALAWPGPALIHLHAPSPLRHGFPADATLERARSAVEGRAHVLFRYDPSAEGLFGLRASLEGNPGLDEAWGGVTFADWAAGEGRFAQHFEPFDGEGGVPVAEWLSLGEGGRRGKVPVVEVDGRTLAVGDDVARVAAARLDLWNTLRELTGTAGPFAERIRAALETEVEADHQRVLEELRAECDGRVAEVRSGADREALLRVRERLMTLAGFPRKEPRKGNGA